uniref:Vacuolar protein sorting-associated protein 54 N-terminal domain-containing protein n=1 Tax=Vombatus ursinus TaxID=29139 RepID=A0A4X2LJ89_VOMUR
PRSQSETVIWREELGALGPKTTNFHPCWWFCPQKLPPVLNLQELEAYRDKLKQQQAAVSKKVADLILEKQPAYVKELERVTSLQTGLQLATVICTNGRRHLNVAKEGFTQASLGLLANQRKRQLLVGLLKSLRTIKTLQRTDVRLSEMLEEEDYPGAIQLCLECQQAASTFRHYSCISELDSKLQDTLEQIEEQLDVALSKICKNFDVSHYTKVQQAYRLLGKTQTAMDQLHMHFTQAIHNTVFQVVLGYVELCAGNTDTKFQKLQYKDLCTHVTTDSYIPCLADLCKALWEVMLSYYRTMEWHEAHDSEDTTRVAEGGGTTGSEESNFDRSYVRKKLEHGLSRIWQDVQLKVKTYLFGTDMSTFKYDDFIFVLDIISRLMQVGEEFCGSKSEVLQDSIRKQSINYFKNYHRTRLDELRMFLENETWELCPVKSSFSILQLHEFKFMEQSRSPSVSPSKQPTSAASSTAATLFEQYCSGGNPFEIQANSKDEETEDVLASNGYESDEPEKSAYQDYDSDSDVPEELKRDFVDEQTGDVPVKSVSRETLRSRKKSDYSLNKVNAPILTNTTLNVIRLVGKYMQMMSMLKPIAFDVVHFLSQLFDYYLYAVYTFFGRNDSVSLASHGQVMWGARCARVCVGVEGGGRRPAAVSPRGQDKRGQQEKALRTVPFLQRGLAVQCVGSVCVYVCVGHMYCVHVCTYTCGRSDCVCMCGMCVMSACGVCSCMCVCVCAHVCEWECVYVCGAHILCACVYLCVWEVCLCVHMCYMHMCVLVYMWHVYCVCVWYMLFCVCVCVCVVAPLLPSPVSLTVSSHPSPGVPALVCV